MSATEVTPAVAPAHAAPSPTRDREAPTPGRELEPFSVGYIAGLDGLRGVALLTILAYHHGIASARGGIFTVSTFFTLSGFLIASLALSEWSRSGGFSLAAFWERRVRRLLPAALVAVVAVVVLQAVAGVGSSDRFRGDTLGALAYVANWRLAYSSRDYAAAFTLEAPVQHFWSLAVEEQFYLVFPLLFVGLLAAVRRRWRWVGAAIVLLAAGSYAAAWVMAGTRGNSGLTYYATYTRASEILIGVALAFVARSRRFRALLAGARGVAVGRVAAVVGVVGLGLLWHRVGLGDPFVFRGGTVVNGVLTALVIVACLSPSPGVLVAGLGAWPLRSLGKISYGAYLFHWPVFLLLDEERTGLDGWPSFALRVAVSIAVATMSYFLVELPFRRGGRGWSRRRLAAATVVPAAAVVALTLAVPVRESEATIDLADASGELGPAFPDAVVPAGEPAARVLLVGDSVSWSMLSGLESWNAAHADRIHVDSYRAVACTLAEAGPVRSLGQIERPSEPCSVFRDALPAMLAEGDYDAVVVVMGQKDLSDRLIEGEWRQFGDPVFDEWWRDQAAGLADILAAEGAPVLWTTSTRTRIVRPEDPSRQWDDYPDNDPDRVDRLNEIVSDVVADRPGFEVVDVGGWLRSQPGGEESTVLRGDGIHWFPEASDRLAEWLVPQVLDAASGP